MKVALISCFGYYEQRIRYVKEAFEKEGHDVHIFFSDFDHINKEKITQEIEGIEYIHAKPYYKNLSLTRIYSHFRFSYSVYKRINAESFDLIYAIIPPNTLCRLLKKYKKKHHVKVIYDIYDLWPESFVYKTLERLAYPFFIYWKNQRNHSVNAADFVVTECDLYQEVLKDFVESDKMKTIYLSKDSKRNVEHIDKAIDNEIHICYLGSINNIINTDLIKQFLRSLNAYKPVVLEIIGKGETKEHFISELRSTRIRIIDHGALYGADKEAILKRCHFGINMMIDAAKVGLTMKSIDYFENSLPLLNNIKGDTWRLIDAYHTGFNIEKNNYAEAAKAVASLSNEEYNLMYKNTRELFNEKFSSDSFKEGFKDIIDKVLDEKLNILVVSQYYYPEQFRINDVCEALVKEGHHVSVLTGLPNYPEGIVPERYKKFKNREEKINGVEVIRSYLVGRGHRAYKLFLNYLSFMITACFKKHKLPKKEYDAIFVYEISPVTQIFPAYIYKRRFKCPLYVNCQDVWPEVIKVYNIKESSLVFKTVKRLSKWLYHRADKILVSSKGFEEYLNLICEIPYENMSYLPNHAEKLYSSFSNIPVKKEKVHMLFAGNIGIAQDLTTLINAVHLMPIELRKQLIVDIVGDGSFLPRFKEIVKELKIETCFVFHGKKQLSELQEYYELADAYIMTLEGGTFVSNTVPAKLQGYMGAGKPILAAIDGQAQQIIKEADCGLYCNAGDYVQYSKLLSEFVTNIENYRQMGDNGREFYMNNFTIEKYIAHMLDNMREEGKYV